MIRGLLLMHNDDSIPIWPSVCYISMLGQRSYANQHEWSTARMLWIPSWILFTALLIKHCVTISYCLECLLNGIFLYFQKRNRNENRHALPIPKHFAQSLAINDDISLHFSLHTCVHVIWIRTAALLLTTTMSGRWWFVCAENESSSARLECTPLVSAFFALVSSFYLLNYFGDSFS